jgi:hypothetical protein
MRRLAAFAFVTLCLGLFAFAADDKTFKPDDEGYIRNWLLLEPVKLTEDVSSHTEEQEKPVFDKDWVKKDYTPRDGDKLKANDTDHAWSAKESSDAIVDLTGLFEGKDTQQCVFLGVAYVTAPQEMTDVKLSIGSDDSSIWRLNGKEIVRVYSQRSVEKDTDQSQPVTLKKGANTLQFAVIQGDGPAGAVARFVDKDGNPVKGLTISLAPAGK